MADSPSPVPMVDSPYQSPAHPETGSVPSLLPPSFTSVSPGLSGLMYRQVYHHWFLKTEVEGKVFWNPFSMKDSLALEDAFTSTDISPDTVVATNGGRYDVNILRRERLAVYWDEPPHEVRRCSWFSKSMLESRYIPYEENISTRLEEEYKVAVTTNTWGKRVELPNGEEIVLRGFNDIVHYPNSMMPDAWGGPQPPQRPRTVKRGVDEFHIEEGESDKIDHLLFVVHGIGSVCDLKFRKVEEVVEDFRSLSQQLVQSHFSSSFERGVASRVEVLPVSWHSTLHGEATGIDRKLRNITLRSIPKLRHFTNDTLLDILFYTSPVYCQTIMDTVGNELNRIYEKFLERNPSYEGGVSLVGHSLGSVILFDMLCHQKVRPAELNSDAPADGDDSCSIGAEVIGDEDAVRKVPPEERKLCQRMSYVMGRAGTGQPYITYPQIKFHPSAFFALGSPIAMFVTVRGNEMLGEDFTLPTCPAFFNIFHPFDPVAYRVEALINPESTTLRPLLIPHHKGRKRMHLELKETMTRLGTDLKQRVVESVRSTWNAMYQLAMFHRSDDAMLEEEVNKVLEQQMSEHHEAESSSSTNGDVESDMFLGRLNGGRRIDHVLQEAPLESFNEYVFAMTSHVCYWDSEDTMLLILKELYGSLGISADSITSQPSERPQESSPQPQFDAFSTGFTSSAATTGGLRMPGESYTSPLPSEMSFDSVGRQQVLGMDPTAPPSDNQNVGPPPMSGFVKKT
ncbi:SEC23-interacting protein isoform X2 [Bacillus rossius redtenbacheri]